MNKIIEFIKKSPKVELHLHIEGTLEPDHLFKLAKKNDVKIPFTNVNEIKSAYNFQNLKNPATAVAGLFICERSFRRKPRCRI